METKCTPGPWQTWNFNDDPRHIAVGPKSGGLAIAEIVACNAHGCYTAETERQAMENARLIAAAPDLLNALDELLEHVQWRRRTEGETAGPRDVTHRARAAIDRARGQ